MIKFNQLSITPDGRKMVIDINVKDHDFLKDVYLDSVIIDAGDTYMQGGPSSHPHLIRKIRWEDSMDKPKMCCSLLIKNSHVILERGYIYQYTGEEIKPKVAVVLGGELLRENTDYTLEYSNNLNVGLATITITGNGQFTGSRTKVFDIVDMNEKSIQNCVIKVPQTYYKYEEEEVVTESTDESTGKTIYNTTTKPIQIKPSVTVINGGDTLVKGTDYTVSYGENNAIGEGTITITGKGDYTESRTITFQIVAELPEDNPEIVVNPSVREEATEESDDSDDSDSSESDSTEEKCNCGCADAKVPEDFDPTDVKVKHARLLVDWQDMIAPMHNSLFFVYAKAKGEPTSDAPCGKDNVYTLGIAVNLYPVYNSFLCALKALDSDCNVPKNLIDMYLRYFSFNINIKTGHYIEAIRIWEKWFMPLTRNFRHHSHVGIVADIYPNHAFTHGHHPLRDYQAHNAGIDWSYWHNHYGHHPWHILDDKIHYEHLPYIPPKEGDDGHRHEPFTIPYFDFDEYWFYGMPFDPFNPIHHNHIHPHHPHPKPDEIYTDEYGHRYWEHENVDMPISMQIFGGPMNTGIGLYDTFPVTGGCNCGK